MTACGFFLTTLAGFGTLANRALIVEQTFNNAARLRMMATMIVVSMFLSLKGLIIKFFMSTYYAFDMMLHIRFAAFMGFPEWFLGLYCLMHIPE